MNEGLVIWHPTQRERVISSLSWWLVYRDHLVSKAEVGSWKGKLTVVGSLLLSSTYSIWSFWEQSILYKSIRAHTPLIILGKNHKQSPSISSLPQQSPSAQYTYIRGLLDELWIGKQRWFEYMQVGEKLGQHSQRLWHI